MTKTDVKDHPFVRSGGYTTLVGETFKRPTCITCGRVALYHKRVADEAYASEVQQTATTPPWHPR